MSGSPMVDILVSFRISKLHYWFWSNVLLQPQSPDASLAAAAEQPEWPAVWLGSPASI